MFRNFLFILGFPLFTMVNSDEICDRKIENMLKSLLYPQDPSSIQMQALRRELMQKLQDTIEDDSSGLYKRSFSSLAQWNNLPATPIKRNLAALARGGYLHSEPEPDESFKRSTSDLNREDGDDDDDDDDDGDDDINKRSIEALARNGELLKGRQQLQELLHNYEKRYFGKRNIASIVRGGKRNNVAAMLRQDNYLKSHGISTDNPQMAADKRNLGSIKAHYPGKFKRDTTKFKRQASSSYYNLDNEEFSTPNFQNQITDEDETLLALLTRMYANNQKRFLGAAVRSGWLQPSRFYPSVDKRHIGAVARLGWLPTLRSIRRFNRSGRSTSDYCREITADGQTEDNSLTQDPSFSLDENKRFLLQPAVDNILLKKILIHHPRSHHFIRSV